MIVHFNSLTIACGSFAAGVLVGMIIVLVIFMLAFRNDRKATDDDWWGTRDSNPPSVNSGIRPSDLTAANRCHHGSTFYKELRDCDVDPKDDLYPYIFQCDGCNKWYVPIFPHPAIKSGVGATAKLGGFPNVASAISSPSLIEHRVVIVGYPDCSNLEAASLANAIYNATKPEFLRSIADRV